MRRQGLHSFCRGSEYRAWHCEPSTYCRNVDEKVFCWVHNFYYYYGWEISFTYFVLPSVRWVNDWHKSVQTIVQRNRDKIAWRFSYLGGKYLRKWIINSKFMELVHQTLAGYYVCVPSWEWRNEWLFEWNAVAQQLASRTGVHYTQKNSASLILGLSKFYAHLRPRLYSPMFKYLSRNQRSF